MRQRSSRTGGALFGALAFVAVSMMIVAGVGGLVVSHYARANVESDYARALHLAESGANYELRHMSRNLYSNPHLIHHGFPQPGQNGPGTFNIGGGSVIVRVVDTRGNGPWIPGRPARIIATGRSNGVERTIDVLAWPDNGFNPILPEHRFLLFGIENVRVNGAIALLKGSLGTNGTLTFNGASIADVRGSVVLCGSSFSASSPNVFVEPEPLRWPTVQEVVRQYFPSGMTALQTQNNNDRIQRFHPSVAGFPLDSAVSAGVSKSTWTLNNAVATASHITVNNFGGDRPRKDGGWRYATHDEGLFGRRTLIFPPGHYYFETVDVTSSNAAILIDNRHGPVNIWIGGSLSTSDTISVPIILANPDRPDLFRIYHDKQRDLTLSGNKTSYGMIYMVRVGGSGDYRLSSGTAHYGAIVANRIVVSGNTQVYGVEVPRNSPKQGFLGGPALGYLFAGDWRESNPSGRQIFNDGTRY